MIGYFATEKVCLKHRLSIGCEAKKSYVKNLLDGINLNFVSKANYLSSEIFRNLKNYSVS